MNVLTIGIFKATQKIFTYLQQTYFYMKNKKKKEYFCENFVKLKTINLKWCFNSVVKKYWDTKTLFT